MKAIFRRLSYVAVLWIGAGSGSLMFHANVGACGCILGMFSGVDLYWSLGNQPKRFWLMLLMSFLGIPFGFLYDHLLSAFVALPPRVNVMLWGAVIGVVFGLASTGLGHLFGAGRNTASRECERSQQVSSGNSRDGRSSGESET